MKPVRDTVYFGGNYFSPWARDWMPDGLADPNSEDKPYVAGGNKFEAYWRTLMTDCIAHPSRRLSQQDLKEYTEIFNEWRQKACLLLSSNPEQEKFGGYDGDQDLLYKMGAVASRTGIDSLISEWQFAELDGGVYAMVPWASRYFGENKPSKIGDLVVVVDGGKVALVLRKKSNITHPENSGVKWEVIGTAYAHEFMDRLASQWAEDRKFTREDFDLY